MPTRTPIFVAAFNRPDCLKEVLAVVRMARPSHVYVSLDAPRAAVDGEKERCAEVRRLVEETEFGCPTTLDIAGENLGCGKRLSTGLTSFFEKFDRGIILEDDTVPSLDFFSFCDEALSVFENNPEVGHVCGSRFENGEAAQTPLRTVHPHIWGWATWAKMWKHYEFDMKAYGNSDARLIARTFVNDDYIWQRWLDSFERVKYGRVDTWDYQWVFACWLARKCAVVPPVNMIKNIGFGPMATHTKRETSEWSRATEPLRGKIKWTDLLERNLLRDREIQKFRYGYMPANSLGKNLLRRGLWHFQDIINAR